MTFVAFKAVNVFLNVALAIAFGLAGLYSTDFGVGWVFVANLAASAATLLLVLTTTDRTLPIIDRRLLAKILVYSLPLLISGLAGTANEFIDRQMIKYLAPGGEAAAMAELGVYGAIVKIAVVMTLFTQMYRLAAEPFFLSSFKKSDFVEANAAAMKYFVMASAVIFTGIVLFKDMFALIVGERFRQGIGILPLVLAANVLSGIWLNLSFWYKREEKTRYAAYITFLGLGITLALSFLLVPRWGYRGAAWVRLAAEAAMVVWSYILCRRHYPIPYDLGRMGEYALITAAIYGIGHAAGMRLVPAAAIGVNCLLFAAMLAYMVRREKIDVKGLLRAVIHRGRV